MKGLGFRKRPVERQSDQGTDTETLSYREMLSGSSRQGPVQNKTKCEGLLKGIPKKLGSKDEKGRKERGSPMDCF